jgi:4'-phosphopantetheinyl transferase
VSADGVELSITHSGDLVGVAIADVPVGIDVERIDPALDVDVLARMVLTPDEAQELKEYDGLNKIRAFTTYWTRKEAVVKATGEGLRTDLRSVDPYRAIELVTDPDYRAALAVVSAGPPVVQTFSFESDRLR